MKKQHRIKEKERSAIQNHTKIDKAVRKPTPECQA